MTVQDASFSEFDLTGVHRGQGNALTGKTILKPALLSILALLAMAALATQFLLPGPDARAAEGKAESLVVGSVGNFTLFNRPKPVPTATFRDGEGREMALSAFRGKVVLVNLWATWCLPCRLEMGSLDRLAAELGGKDFAVVAISMDRGGKADVERFFKEIHIKNLGLYIDDTTKSAKAYGAHGLPVSFVLNRDGLEVGRLIGPAEWDSPEALALIRHFIQAPVTPS
jgi:thiol-disulfide isomerase/thioredoxin